MLWSRVQRRLNNSWTKRGDHSQKTHHDSSKPGFVWFCDSAFLGWEVWKKPRNFEEKERDQCPRKHVGPAMAVGV